MNHCAEQRERNDNDCQGTDRWIDPVTDLTCQHSRQRAFGYDSEYGCVVVLERCQKSQDRCRCDGRLQKRQENLAEHLGLGRPEIQRGLFKARVKTLQAGQKHQHGIGGDKRRLANDGHEITIIEKPVLSAEHYPVYPLPEHQR